MLDGVDPSEFEEVLDEAAELRELAPGRSEVAGWVGRYATPAKGQIDDGDAQKLLALYPSAKVRTGA